MISRRNIRIKVLQTLYSIDKMDTQLDKTNREKNLLVGIESAQELLIHTIYILIQVSLYAKIYSSKKSSKHLPSEADLNVNVKLSESNWVTKMQLNNSYIILSQKFKLESRIDRDIIKTLFEELVVTDTYSDYINSDSDKNVEDKEIFPFIFNDILLANDTFIDHITDHFANWENDCEMLETLVYIAFNKPSQSNFQKFVSGDKLEYGINLLHTVCDKKAHLKGIIEPKLKNWDIDRIANLDIITLQMGIAEFLYFDTIPVRVTINEYIDIAKVYSTEQSGQFINGILDSTLRDLKQQNKIQKIVFKNSTL